NTYAGTTTISNGGISMGVASGTAIAGNIVIAGGNLDYANSVNDQIASTSAVTMTSGGFDLGSRAQTIAGLSMSGGTLSRQTGILTLSGASTITGGTLSFTATGSDVRADGALELGGATFTYGGSTAASGGFRVGGNVTYGSGNTVAALFTNTGGASSVGRLNLNNGTRTFDIADIGALGSEVNVGWSVQNGSLIKTGAGVMTMTASNTYDNTTLNGGTLRLGNNFALGAGTVSISNNSVIASDGATARSFANVIDIAGDVTFGDATGTGALTFSATNADNLGAATRTLTTAVDTTIAATLTNTSGNITKAGAATLYLSNANSSFGTLTITQGRVAFQTNATITGLAGSGGSLALSGGALTVSNSANSTYNDAISGSGALTKSGAATLTLGGANSFTGVTTINAGAVSVAAANGLGADPVSAVTNQITLGGGALEATASLSLGNRGITVGAGGGTINVASSQNLTQTSGLYGSGALTKTGAGTLTLGTTAGSFNGTATIGGGTLAANTALGSAAIVVSNTGTLVGSGSVGNVTVQSGGTINPGLSPGTLSMSNLVLAGGGNYNWQIYDATGVSGATNGYDLILGNSLNITANSGSQFNINLWSLSGIGPDTNGPAINFSGTNSYSWTIATFTNGITNFSASSFAINTAAINNTAGFANSASGTFAVTTNANSLLLTYTALATSFDVTVTNGSFGQGAASGVLGGSNLFTGASTLNISARALWS
ncbi:MAG: beta strand repeat-containing protein, partial [Sphaerospermopsis kisseleviana]